MVLDAARCLDTADSYYEFKMQVFMLVARTTAAVRKFQQQTVVPLLAAVVCAVSGTTVYLVSELIEDCSEVCTTVYIYTPACTVCNTSQHQVHTCSVSSAQCLLRAIQV
jgi:hypothetical protein